MLIGFFVLCVLLLPHAHTHNGEHSIPRYFLLELPWVSVQCTAREEVITRIRLKAFVPGCARKVRQGSVHANDKNDDWRGEEREREGEGAFGKKGRPYLNVFFEANELRNVRTGGMTAEADRRRITASQHHTHERFNGEEFNAQTKNDHANASAMCGEFARESESEKSSQLLRTVVCALFWSRGPGPNRSIRRLILQSQ